MRVYYESYGCTANRGDLEVMLGLLGRAGHHITPDRRYADIALLNTCAVKGTTYRRMLSRIGELLKQGNKVLVAGCLPLVDLESVLGLQPHGVISCRTLESVVEAVEKIGRGETPYVRILGDGLKRARMPRLALHPVSAIVNIADGCTSSCAYCSVRLARGNLRSLSMDEVVVEVKEALGRGQREIMLTAQDTAAYGLDLGCSLPELLKRVCSLEGRFMVRVGMMHPGNAAKILNELLVAYESEKVYKFIHLPVQSGDDHVLELMGRRYRAEDYVEAVDTFRSKFPDLYLSTDIIVGFPGEGEDEFKRTLEVIERTMPDKVNISRFSPMPGTKAARMKRPNPREVAERSRRLASLVSRLGSEVNRRYVGREWWGLVTECGKKGGFTVRLPNYKPVIVRAARPSDFIRVRITGHTSTYLLGENLGEICS